MFPPLKPLGAGEGKPGAGRGDDLSRLVAELSPVWRDCVISVGTGAGMMAFQPTDLPRRVSGGWKASSGPARLHLRKGARVLAFETISADPLGWNHAVALCGRGGGHAPSGGPPSDDAPLFDLGGDDVVRLRFRPAEGGIDREETELPLTPGLWQVETDCAAIEIDHPGGAAPVHRIGGKPARTTPLPPGWVAEAHVFPPHPARMRPGQTMAFDPARHAVFQGILARHGRADLVDLKARVLEMLQAGQFQRMALDRHGVTVVRVALRQQLALTRHAPPDDWLCSYDRPLRAALAGRPAMIDSALPPT